jgi:hypothetical protein
METRKLIVILADISGYTRFMLENRTAALHGQIVINGLIESILREVDIPLTLQEIEGDAVFLYAAHPGSEHDWQDVIEQVSRKLMRFFDAFIAQSGAMMECTPCPCPICHHADQLGLKIIVHVGEAVFHAIAGRPQVSGPDVILGHRLLKNSVASNEYLLLTDAAFDAMGRFLSDGFVAARETYDGFGTVNVRVRPLDAEMLAARDAVYALDRKALDRVVARYVGVVGGDAIRGAARDQLRNPTRPLSRLDRVLLRWEAWVMPMLMPLRWIVTHRILARGHRKPPSLASG